MLSHQDILCFAPDSSWHGLWRNRHQIMTRLARRNRVLFIEPAPYLRPVLTAAKQQGAQALREETLFSPMDNLWVYRSPSRYPISGRWPLREMTFALRKRHLRGIMSRLGMKRPILWVFRYDLGEMIGHLDEKLVIYHAVDEYAGYALEELDPQARARAQRIRAMERDLVQRVDLIFVTSPTLLESKRAWNPNIYLVPNGVDYHHFARPPRQTPADIAAIPRPRVGYAGAINEKLDLALLEALARERPDWNLVLVGPNLLKRPQALDALRALPNVHLLGRKSIDDLPAYMHSFDVCLMPYAHNLWTENISPLKLYEYLAAGRPIVSTAIPAVQDFRDVVQIVDNRAAFASMIEQILRQDAPEDARRRQALARRNTWSQRVEILSSIIQGYLT
ncbi:MAG TPA: glycosyltransferase family 1 protein [Anaerolineae bacterium]|nr:glycosyltransferase family 1 protein [Caldilineae bacterium]HID34660.1 glycosyltransferase family 1 protein [Anaerolineae bacterium]HIQ12369.1 glycosyltransferase family 1 protein [Caldilineales bacterium]